MICNIWTWLNVPNNAGAVQAVAAFLTFLAMLHLGYKQYGLSKQQNRLVDEQKEITRRQINLALYEKRYEIYMELLKLLNTVTHEIQLPDEASAQIFMNQIGAAIIDFKAITHDRIFLLDETVNKYIDDVLVKIDFMEKLVVEKVGIAQTANILIFLNNDSDIKKSRVALELEEKEVIKQFTAVLDFRKI